MCAAARPSRARVEVAQASSSHLHTHGSPSFSQKTFLHINSSLPRKSSSRTSRVLLDASCSVVKTAPLCAPPALSLRPTLWLRGADTRCRLSPTSSSQLRHRADARGRTSRRTCVIVPRPLTAARDGGRGCTRHTRRRPIPPCLRALACRPCPAPGCCSGTALPGSRDPRGSRRAYGSRRDARFPPRSARKRGPGERAGPTRAADRCNRHRPRRAAMGGGGGGASSRRAWRGVVDATKLWQGPARGSGGWKRGTGCWRPQDHDALHPRPLFAGGCRRMRTSGEHVQDGPPALHCKHLARRGRVEHEPPTRMPRQHAACVRRSTRPRWA